MPNPCEEKASIHQIVCALILGADHPITPNEIQKIIETVEQEDRAAEATDAADISDEELEAAQAEADRKIKEAAAGINTGAVTPVETQPQPEKLELKTETPKTISVAAIKKVIADLQKQFHEFGLGMELMEVSGGYRFQTSSDCGKWVRKMLNKGKPTRLARPAIETLAIIAYRQPVSRSEIESIRGVCAGHVIKALMEMQLVRIIGRSDLPGRPFLFGTTPSFLDHFGLKSLKDLDPIKK